jgi:hypothetical protein
MQMLLGGAAPFGYNLLRSLRFRASASAYLNRTPASAGNRKTWTWSGWVKRGQLGVDFGLFSAGTNSSINIDAIEFNTSDQLRIYSYNTTYIFHYITTQVFRDPSGWYHIVLAVDTTDATASNRVKIYVNGVQVTAFGTQIDPSLNADCAFFNNTNAHVIGATFTDSKYLDGYQTEVNFTDGQALTPASFGSFSPFTGVWQPAKYTGAYGTNGFYLPFTDNSTAAALGTDFSGNSNTWTVNNISVTAGVTYDSMTDVPTLTSAAAANYCVFNAAAQSTVVNGTVTRSNGNLTSTDGGTTYGLASFGTIASTTGKWYWEVTLTSAGGSFANIGVVDLNQPLGTNLHTGITYAQDGDKGSGAGVFGGSGSTAYGASYTTGDVIGVALDLDGGSITFYKNGVSQGVAYTGISGNYTPGVGDAQNTTAYTFDLNCGQRPFAYTPPTGFVALNTFNLAESTIEKGGEYFNPVLYTGNGATQSITGVGFQPDFIWFKRRDAAAGHALNDSVRGVTKSLTSNGADSEYTSSAGTDLVSFDSDGFTVGATNVWNSYNVSGGSLVAWNWKAGGAAVTNTDGTISAQVSANPTAGFSVVTYTGNGVNNATVGHGLGVTPAMVINKVRTGSTGPWYVKHKNLTSGTNIFLEQTAAQTALTPSGGIGDLNSSSTFTCAAGSSNSENTNASGRTYVAYVFAEIAGYSKFGSYTGNGSTDGPFVYTGFRPAFVMIKRTNSTGQWILLDTARNTINTVNSGLWADANEAESTSTVYSTDFVSNGFKVRNAGADRNASGGTYIYMALAENPFRNSLAR